MGSNASSVVTVAVEVGMEHRGLNPRINLGGDGEESLKREKRLAGERREKEKRVETEDDDEEEERERLRRSVLPAAVPPPYPIFRSTGRSNQM